MKKVVYNAIPSGVVMGLTIFGITLFKQYLFSSNIIMQTFRISSISELEFSTFFVFFIGIIQIWTLLEISRPLTLYRKMVFLSIVILFTLGLLVPYSIQFFNLAKLSLELFMLAISLSVISIFIIWVIKKGLRKTIFRKEVEI